MYTKLHSTTARSLFTALSLVALIAALGIAQEESQLIVIQQKSDDPQPDSPEKSDNATQASEPQPPQTPPQIPPRPPQPPEPGIPADKPETDASEVPATDVPQSLVPSDPPEPEVLAHGPVHEAFAGPNVDAHEDGVVVARQPPEAIDEVPPEYVPEGDNVEWIPGYWGWDDEANDYLWVSGLWREVPPGQRWVPGHWAEVEGGYRWVSGFWTGVDTADLEYLPYPPESLDQGPNVDAPGDNYFWNPGCWVYQSSAYQWQPGYWAPAYDDWCWTPRRYIWTPRGALFSAGYWDYRFPRRGLLFAPLRFGNPYLYGPRYRYRPFYTINPTGLLVSLFVRPRYGHYYFGDYYGPRYRDRGYQPWYLASGPQRRYSDPLYSFYNSYYRRKGIDFGERMSGWQRYFDEHPDRRPARTIDVSTRQFDRNPDQDRRSPIRLADSLTRLAESRDQSEVRLRRLSDPGRESIADATRQIRSLAQSRGTLERGRPDDADPQGLSARLRSLQDSARRDSNDRPIPRPGENQDRPGRASRDTDSSATGPSRDVAASRLSLPKVVENRLQRSLPESSSRLSSRPDAQPSARQSLQPPSLGNRENAPSALDRLRSRDAERSLKPAQTPSSLRERFQQIPRSIDQQPKRPDSRAPDSGSRERLPTRRGQNSPQSSAPESRAKPSAAPKIDRGRIEGILQQRAPQPRSESRQAVPSGPRRSLPGSSAQPAPRPQPRSIAPSRSSSSRETSRGPSGPSINRSSRSSGPSAARSSRPQVRSPSGSRGPSRGSSNKGKSSGRKGR